MSSCHHPTTTVLASFSYLQVCVEILVVLSMIHTSISCLNVIANDQVASQIGLDRVADPTHVAEDIFGATISPSPVK